MRSHNPLRTIVFLFACIFFIGCAHKPPGYKEAMLNDRTMFVSQGAIDQCKQRSLSLFEQPDGFNLVGYIRDLKPDTNQQATVGFTEEGGGRFIVRVPTRMTNGTPVLVETQYDYADGTGTGEVVQLSFTVLKKK